MNENWFVHQSAPRRDKHLSLLRLSSAICDLGSLRTDYRVLQKRGFSIFAFDAHSFGKSEPLEPAYLRSYVLNPHHLVDDVYTYVEVRVRVATGQEPDTLTKKQDMLSSPGSIISYDQSNRLCGAQSADGALSVTHASIHDYFPSRSSFLVLDLDQALKSDV